MDRRKTAETVAIFAYVLVTLLTKCILVALSIVPVYLAARNRHNKKWRAYMLISALAAAVALWLCIHALLLKPPGTVPETPPGGENVVGVIIDTPYDRYFTPTGIVNYTHPDNKFSDVIGGATGGAVGEYAYFIIRKEGHIEVPLFYVVSTQPEIHTAVYNLGPQGGYVNVSGVVIRYTYIGLLNNYHVWRPIAEGEITMVKAYRTQSMPGRALVVYVSFNATMAKTAKIILYP
jgi:hypothetical protein